MDRTQLCRILLTLIAVIALSTTVAFGGEWIIFSEKLPPGADLALRGDSQFVVSTSHPCQGANHLKRDFATYGTWAWITGIMNLNLDLSGIDFDTAYIEFYIDGGTIPIGYLELRLGGAEWNPDFRNTSVTVDDQPGYERVRVMLKDFTGGSRGTNPTNLDEFTGGTGRIDRISWGFGAAGDLFVDEVRILDAAGAVTTIASNPVPAHGEADVSRDASLGWKPGQFAHTHDVYLGTGFEDVGTASRQSPRGVLVSQDQEGATFASAGLLEFGTTYYWRIDEINAPPDSTVFKGEVWSFTVEPYAYPISNVTATASSARPGMGAENTVNGSGLDADDQHSTEGAEMWLSAGAQPNWIQFEFDQAYSLHELWVWNSNQLVEAFIGFGAKDVTVEYSLDGANWTTLEGVPEFARATAAPAYTHNTTVAFDGAVAKYVKLTINSNWGGLPASGLSEVRFFAAPVRARRPEPADAATDAAIDATLNWRPGRAATSHRVYFGTDANAVADAAVAAETVADHRFCPAAMNYGTTYYWRVDEVGDGGTYEGDVWSFTTQEYAVVDDFESYNDGDNRIYLSWIDGVTNGKSGSTVGYFEAPFAEKTLVHGGAQSMPLAYDNKSMAVSEATLTFDSAQDWTERGLKSLSLYFQGAAANTGGTLYLKINGTKVTYKGDASDIAKTAWLLWNIDLSTVGGNLNKVTSLTIGVEGSGATGIVYIDDIRLYPNASGG